MEENGSSNEPNSNSKWPLFIFFKGARDVFKLDALSRELLGIAFPSALAVAADPIASLIDTAFIGHIGPVELAAAGVSIALFNQASRITIFPLVSITTSFVAEEDTLEKLKEVIVPEEHMLQHMEKGSLKHSNNISPKPLLQNSESKDPEVKSFGSQALQNNHATRDNHTETGDEANKSICKSSWITKSGEKDGKKKKKRRIASASTALLFGTILGLIQTAVLIFAAKPLLRVMGVKPDSPMLNPAEKYLKLRSIGAPAVLLSLAMQGIFRGFKDTTTPLYVIVSGYAFNVILDPILIFTLKLGIKGAAISHVLSQYMMAITLLLILMKKVHLLPPSIKDLQIFRFLKNGGLLMLRVIAVTFCVTLAASLAARLGSIPMAAFQTCLQVWLTSSLLADGLAVAVQAILACSFAEKDYKKTTAAAIRTLQMAFVLGMGLSLTVGLGLYFGAGIFSRNIHVVHLIKIGLPFVAATQPINSLAFVFDGVNYGASDFAYAACSLVVVSIVSVAIEFVLYRAKHFIGIWIALTIYMTLRMLAGVWRMGTGTGPWHYLRGCSLT
ncbi:protein DETOXIFICATION 43-like isoform X1 [Vigna unguiculata]|uniref:protein DETOXIFICATION 43-like isoform X1 n=1 Tax=Vigna unguiculata TaxID=3917 RepID=UPI001015E086|nr:protein DETOXIFICATION 43-like isoform X1 [Vigna unguiculata]